MIIKDQQEVQKLPKQRLLLRIPVTPDSRNLYYPHVFSGQVLRSKPKTTILCYKSSDSKISVLIFELRCMTNCQSYLIQEQPNKHITVVKVRELRLQPDSYIVFLVIGYDNGLVELYDYYNGCIKVRDFTSEDGERVVDVHLENKLLCIVRAASIQFYKIESDLRFLFEVNIVLSFSPVAFLLGKKHFYISSHTFCQIWDRQAFKYSGKIQNIGVCCFLEPKGYDQLVLAGCDDDSIRVIDLKTKIKYRYCGFNSFVVSLFQTSQGIWALSRDGRAICFRGQPDPNRQKAIKQEIQSKTITFELDKESSRLHSEGVVSASTTDDFILIMDLDDHIAIYQPNLSKPLNFL